MAAANDREVTRFLEAWLHVRQFIQAANFNRFQREGLSATQFMTLNLLPADGEGIAIGDLARRMNLAPATVAKTVDSLEARNMVARARSATDRRLVFVSITPPGKLLQNNAQGHFREQIETLFQAMPTAHRQGLVLGLESLMRVAQDSGQATRTAAKDAPRDAAPAKRSARRSPLR